MGPPFTDNCLGTMRILFLTRSLDIGGAERQLVLLANGLHAHGHHVVVATFYSGGPLEKELIEAGVHIRPLYKRGRWDIAGFLRRLIRAVREEQPEIVNSYLTNLVTTVLRPFAPDIKIVWSIRCSFMDFDRYDWLHRLTDIATCWLSGFSDLVIANSYAGRKEYIAKGYPANKIQVISNGIDTSSFYPNEDSRKRLRREWFIRDDHELIGLVGRLDPMKDHPTFLRAAALLRCHHPTARFICVGSGPVDYQRFLCNLANELGLSNHITWLDARTDMPDVYNALDLLVSSSYGEGFSNVLGEAMACGVPCVATNVGDSGFVIGQWGELVIPKAPEALTAGMQRALERKLPRIEIRQRIIDHFSLNALVAKTERVLLDLIDGQGHDSLVPEGGTDLPRC